MTERHPITLHPGEKYNRLTVIRRAEPPSPYIAYSGRWYLCRCDCGNETVVRARAIKVGTTKSCGCLRRETTRQLGRKGSVKPGEKYGRLTVVKEGGRVASKAILWECICDCGNTTYVRGTNLKSGRTKSCGCLRDERTREYHRNRRKDNERTD